MQQNGYYRFPTVHRDTIVFVCEDDLWQVPLAGGTARRLTNGLGTVSHPRLSPDGEHIAFTGKEEGDLEVYVMPGAGGPVRRLTYLGSGAVTVGWHPDGRIIFSTYYGNPFMAWRSLYAIAPEGGEPELLPFGRAAWASFGPDGGVVLGRPTTDSSRWKRYRGGTRGVLWVDSQGTGEFVRLALENSNLVTPLWIGDRLYVISDHEQHANLYSMNPDGTHLIRHTDHEDYYVRSLATNGTDIVYAAGGDLYRYNITEHLNEKIAVDFHSQRTQREVKHIKAAQFWSDYTFTRDNNTLLITTRGKLYHLAPFAGPVEPLGIAQGVRYRLTEPIDEHRLITVSDEGGEEHLEIREIGPEARINVTRIGDSLGIIDALKVSPSGEFAVLSNERQQLWLLDVKTLELTLVAQTPHGRFSGFDWSPDSRWVAYAMRSKMTAAIYLYELASGQSCQVTRPVLADRQPVFDPDGRYLYFLSRRVFKPVLDNMKFERSFPKGEVPCLITLSDSTVSPFIPRPQPLTAESDETDANSEPVVRIDLEGIQDRVLAFPVNEGIYHHIEAGRGQVFWTKADPRSDAEDAEDDFGVPPATDELVRFDLTDLKEETVSDKCTSFVLSADKKFMAVRVRTELRVIEAGRKVDLKDSKPGKESGVVSLARIHVAVEQLAEWYQMQREAWRQMREIFWVPDMGGVDWNAVYERYRRLLPRVATRGELADLLWEMQGELGTSHAYEYGGQYRAEPMHRTAFLGARFQWNQAVHGYEIIHLVHGDSADVDAASPLLTPGARIKPGDVLTAVNGEPLGRDLPVGARLIDLGGQDVAVSIRAGDEDRIVTVRPLKSEMPARYREWVETNRAYVHNKTDGRVGYIHIPNMVNSGFGEFHRSYLAEFERDGLIVDVRYNSGGIVSPLVLEILGRKRIGFSRWRGGYLRAYPYDSPTGAMVAITNEHAGSDGDIFSHNFKQMQLGPLIGVRTWGGVIGISARYPLVDWTTVTQPEFHLWFKDVGLAVENYGTDPDIVVEETPQATARGIDDQLDRAIQEIEKILETYEPLVPDYEHRVNRDPNPLPRS